MTNRNACPTEQELCLAIGRKVRESVETKQAFFETNQQAIARCAVRMAERFDAGGRLYVMGNGGSACDAQHLAVEMMHPIFEKRPPLPAQALITDIALVSAIGNDTDYALVFARQLELLARTGDIAVGLSTSGQSANVNRGLKRARELGLLTVGFSGRDGGKMLLHCDHSFVVPSYSTHRIQESHETLLHVLWDLIHVIRGEQDIT